MRKLNLGFDPYMIAFTYPEARSSPFSHSVHGEERGSFERRRKERARCMSFVMFRKIDFPFISQALADQIRNVQLLLQPEWHGHEERCPTPRSKGQIRFQESLKLEDGLVVEYDIVQIGRCDTGLRQAPRHGFVRKTMVVLDT